MIIRMKCITMSVWGTMLSTTSTLVWKGIRRSVTLYCQDQFMLTNTMISMKMLLLYE